jgi:hypothetical protein
LDVDERYTHLRQTGDKFSGWCWLNEVAPPQAAAEPQPESTA